MCQTLSLDVTYEPLTTPVSWLVPGRAAAAVHDGAVIGVLGQLHPGVADPLGSSPTDPIYVAELDLDAADAAARRGEIRVVPLPRQPSVTRDVSMLVDDTLPAAVVRNTISEAAPTTLVDVREFDRYAGKGVPAGKVSLSFRLTFQSADRTLTDEEVQAGMQAILDALTRDLGAIQR